MTNKNDRRDFLKAAGATIVAASMPVAAVAQLAEKDDAGSTQQPIYLNGCAWNRELPGDLGRSCFSFDVRATLDGTGVGTIRDDVYSTANSQFAINSVSRHGKTFTLLGEVTASRDPGLIGHRVRIVAESTGEGTGRATITIESPGDNLVVIAIIAVLMGLLLPAIT
jgi:hypothetical protein